MSLENLVALQKSFQPYLKPSDCSFIGPANVGLLGPLIDELGKILAPKKLNESTCREFFSDDVILKAIARFPSIPLRIYVITVRGSDFKMLHHSTIEEYCEANAIEFSIDAVGKG